MDLNKMDDSRGLPGRVEFTTTHWSVVLAARDQEPEKAGAALESLCRSYWYPLYAYVRRQGHSPDDAQDLTQACFAHLLSQDFLRNVSPDKGRFRSFLLTCLKRFLADEWRKGCAVKRGAGLPILPLNEGGAESRYLQESSGHADGEALYERRWALTLIDCVLDRLEAEFAAAGKQRMFDQLSPFLLGEKTGQTYEAAAAVLGTTVGAVKMTVLRMRERYRALFREEIAHTVATPAEIEQEIQHVVSVLRG